MKAVNRVVSALIMYCWFWLVHVHMVHIVHAQSCVLVNQVFAIASGQETILECQISPDFDQFSVKYSMRANGVNVYLFTETQYNEFSYERKMLVSYKPKSNQCISTIQFQSNQTSPTTGKFLTQIRPDYGKVRVVAIRDMNQISSEDLIVDLFEITPRKDTDMALIVASIILTTLLCFVVPISITCFIFFKRNTRKHESYEEIA